MADEKIPQRDNKDAESGQPVQLDREPGKESEGGQSQRPMTDRPDQPSGGQQHEGGQKR